MSRHPRKTSVPLLKSPVFQAGCMLALTTVSSVVGFHMGAPVHEVQNHLATITKASPAPLTSSLAASGPLQHHEAPAAAPALASTAVSASALPAVVIQNPAQVAGPDAQMEEMEVSVQPRRRIAAATLVPRNPPRVAVPMAFQEVDPALLGLSVAQSQEIDRMRERFTEQVGTQEPGNPAYRQRWARAQSESDEQLRAFLGWDKFNQYQIAAAQAR